jgi:hypothetical protein
MWSGQGAASVSIWTAAAGAENIFFIMKPNENSKHKYLIFDYLILLIHIILQTYI